eukprot:3071282-Amphidinium_carterae.1
MDIPPVILDRQLAGFLHTEMLDYPMASRHSFANHLRHPSYTPARHASTNVLQRSTDAHKSGARFNDNTTTTTTTTTTMMMMSDA